MKDQKLDEKMQPLLWIERLIDALEGPSSLYSHQELSDDTNNTTWQETLFGRS
jgi:hypothetical protein